MKIDKSLLVNKLRDIPVMYFKETDSTNTQAKNLIFSQPSPFLVIAEKQTLGRGRMGRQFFSDGHGIYMSFVFKTPLPRNAVSVTTAAASGVVSVLEKVSDGDFKIKWVNDILLDDKKVCGILTEGVSCKDEHFVIVGIGINVGECKFPAELEGIAGSIMLKSSPEELISDIVGFLCDFANNSETRDYMSYYRNKSLIFGHQVTATIDGRSIDGTAMGVTDDGGLIFKPHGEDKEVVILSGEVTIRAKK